MQINTQITTQPVPFSTLVEGQPFTGGPPSSTAKNVIVKSRVAGHAMQLQDGADLTYADTDMVYPVQAVVLLSVPE